MCIEIGSLSALAQIKKHIVEDQRTTCVMALPPTLLVLSTELLKIASNILPKEASEAKAFLIVGVCIFSFLILGKKFMLTQMLAIAFITFGLTNFENNSTLSLFTLSSFFTERSIYGYLSIIAAISCYGLCYSILEYNLKIGDSDVSLWIRGIQLNMFSVPISLIITMINHDVNHRGYFDNFNIIALFFIIFVVACNMMELFVIKVADGMFRMISLALATMLIGTMQFVFSIDAISNSSIKLGCGLIISGTILYFAIDLVNPKEENAEQNEEFIASIPLKSNYQSVPTVSYKIKN